MLDLIVKQFNSKDFRFTDINNNPWFVAKDVCNILEIRTDSISSILDEDEYGKIDPNSIGVKMKAKEIIIINESGLYSLILRSRKPEAKKFKKWVTSIVLPAIRKDGEYKATWKEEREKSKKIRTGFTGVLQTRGYKSPIEYIKTTKSMKAKMGINGNKKKDDLDLIELCKVTAAESIAKANLLQSNATGYVEVKPICDSSALMVKIATTRDKPLEIKEGE